MDDVESTRFIIAESDGVTKWVFDKNALSLSYEEYAKLYWKYKDRANLLFHLPIWLFLTIVYPINHPFFIKYEILIRSILSIIILIGLAIGVKGYIQFRGLKKDETEFFINILKQQKWRNK